MLTPIFTHGTLKNTQKAIIEGKIKYPAYCWCVDVSQYGFINKYNQLELIGIPTKVGTSDDIVILSSLEDGLYQIKGLHKITARHSKTFDSDSFIFAVVQTIGETKKVRRITADELTEYTIEEDLSVTENEVITKEYLDDEGYITEEDLEHEIDILRDELEDEIVEFIPVLVDPLVREIISEEIGSSSQESIDALFE